MGSVPEIRDAAPLQHNAMQQSAEASAEQTKPASVPEDQMLTHCNTMQCTGALNERTKAWYLCQRIRMLTEAAHEKRTKTPTTFLSR
jgi:hypothetical protein